MKIINKRVYTGRNIYSHKLCIRLTVDVEDLAETPTNHIPNFNERLLKALPGLRKHCCSLGYEGGFLERLNEGTYISHVFEHMIIEMQNCLGFKSVKYGKAREIKGSLYYVVFEYELAYCGLLCANAAKDCINAFIKNSDYDMDSELKKIEMKVAPKRLGPSTKAIYEEARKRKIPVMRIGDGSILQLGYGKCQKIIESTLSSNTGCIAVDISCSKSLTREVLRDACIPVANGGDAGDVAEVLMLCNKIGYPVVIKPLNGNQGRGVTVDIRDDNAAVKAYKIASKINSNVIVEEYVKGRDYRVLVIDGKIAAVSNRIPPFVVGDGIHTIKELVDIENMNPLRGYFHEKPLTKILIDDISKEFLLMHNMTLDFIPPEDKTVFLRFNGNISTGGMAKDCTDDIHPDNIDIAVRAARAVGLDIAGVDICTKDISKSMNECGGAVLEVNASPGIRMHLFPSIGKGRNVARHILGYMFKDDKPSSIPVVSVTGTNGKTTTVKMISRILSLKGMNVGMSTTTGIYVGDKCVLKGDTTGPDSAKTVLMDKTVDAAVLETARGGILRRGLGYDLADVGVITNITGDHLGIDGVNSLEELAYVKSLVVEAVRDSGYAVLNADDPATSMMLNRIRCNIIYFSMSSDNLMIKKHTLSGGKAVYVKDGYICYQCGDNIQPVVSIEQLPASCCGALDYNIENAMAAAASCIALNVDTESIERGLKTFLLDDKQNPGRFNVYDFKKFKVIVDYGHNIDGYTSVLKGLKKMDAARLVGIIGVPGDRRNEDIMEVGKICGKGFDYIYIKEDVDKRGRSEGEVAALLKQGVISAKRRKSDFKIILNECSALESAIQNAEEGDCIVVFYEDYDGIMDVIKKFKSKNVDVIKRCVTV